MTKDVYTFASLLVLDKEGVLMVMLYVDLEGFDMCHLTAPLACR